MWRIAVHYDMLLYQIQSPDPFQLSVYFIKGFSYSEGLVGPRKSNLSSISLKSLVQKTDPLQASFTTKTCLWKL